MKIHYAAFMALEKAKYIDLFEKKDFTEQEYKFVQAVENSSYKDSLCVTKSCHNKFALAWKSKIKLDLGCLITEKGIELSNPRVCYHDNIEMPASKRYFEGSDQQKIIQEEIQAIKELLLVYSPELESCFY